MPAFRACRFASATVSSNSDIEGGEIRFGEPYNPLQTLNLSW